MNMFKNIKWYNPPLLIALTVLSLSSYAASNNKILVEPTEVTSEVFFDQYNAYGECRREQGRNYYSSVEGTVDFLHVRQGDNVKTGEVIIAINQRVAEATKSYGEAAFKAAEVSYNKDKALFAKNIISLEAMEKTRMNFEEAKVKLAESMRKYNDMVITAPYDGQIGVLKVLIGDKVKPQDYMFSLISESNSSVFLELPEILHEKVSSQTDVILTDSNNNKMKGEISAVSPYLSSNGTITTKALIKNGKCLHGSYISASLLTNKHQGLAVPEQAVLRNEKGSFVYKIGNDNIIKQIYINTGLRTNGMIEILSNNLNIGDKVVLEGLTKVYDNVVVEYKTN